VPLHDFPVRASIAVTDIAHAAEFYETKLELPRLFTSPSAQIEEGGRVYGSAGGPALNVFQTETAGTATSTMATWYVDDLDAVVDELTAAGVEFLRYDGLEHDERGITDRAGGGRLAWFADPDGNVFAVESDD